MDRGVCPGFPTAEGIPFQPPIISQPEKEEVLFAYVVVAFHAVSLVLMRVDNGMQIPVYYEQITA